MGTRSFRPRWRPTACQSRAASQRDARAECTNRVSPNQPSGRSPSSHPTLPRKSCDQDPIHPRTVARPTGQTDGPGQGDDTDSLQRGAGSRTAASAATTTPPPADASRPADSPGPPGAAQPNPDQDRSYPIHPCTAARPAGQADTAAEAADTHSMQRGAGGETAATPAAHPRLRRSQPDGTGAAQAHQPDRNQDRSDPIHPCTAARPTGQADTAAEAADKHSMQRGAGGETAATPAAAPPPHRATPATPVRPPAQLQSAPHPRLTPWHECATPVVPPMRPPALLWRHPTPYLPPTRPGGPKP